MTAHTCWSDGCSACDLLLPLVCVPPATLRVCLRRASDRIEREECLDDLVICHLLLDEHFAHALDERLAEAARAIEGIVRRAARHRDSTPLKRPRREGTRDERTARRGCRREQRQDSSPVSSVWRVFASASECVEGSRERASRQARPAWWRLGGKSHLRRC